MFLVRFRTETALNAQKTEGRRKKEGGKEGDRPPTSCTFTARIDAPSYPQAIAQAKAEYPFIATAKFLGVARIEEKKSSKKPKKSKA